MSLVVSFTLTPTSSASSFILTDTSTGSDGAVTDRQIILYTPQNNQYVPPIDWPIAQSSITISPLTADQALNIVVNWNNSGGVPLYTASQIFSFTQYGEQFLYGLTQNQTSNPSLLNDNNYLTNKYIFRVHIEDAIKAITVGNDIVAAASCIVLYQEMINNQSLYF